MTKFSWHTFPPSDGIAIKQVYGFCFSPDGRLLLREDGSSYGLPGGRPEQGEDLPIDVLKREAMEESQLKIGRVVYLGFQKVEDEGKDPYAQLRYVAVIDEFLPRHADPDTGRTYRRLLVPINRAPSLLDWGTDGLIQCAAAAVLARDTLGIDIARLRTSDYFD